MKLMIKPSRDDRIVSQFSRRKILVFGDVGVDKYTVGKVTRISPEAPIPIVEVTNMQLKLGLAANVADNMSPAFATARSSSKQTSNRSKGPFTSPARTLTIWVTS